MIARPAAMTSQFLRRWLGLFGWVISGIALPLSMAWGEDAVRIDGDLKCWHPLSLSMIGPQANEADAIPNPFIDYSMVVRFRHESGTPDYFVLGYFAADGDAANTGARTGNIWRAHLSPNKAGRWTYEILFRKGPGVAFDFDSGASEKPYDGLSGEFMVAPSDKPNVDPRARGRLKYVGKRHLQYAVTRQRFLRIGIAPSVPLFGDGDFDDEATLSSQLNATEALEKAFEANWRLGDPYWKVDRGKRVIGMLNRCSQSGLNSLSIATFEKFGESTFVSPFIVPANRSAFDCSKLDQWNLVLGHASKLGIQIHIALQTDSFDQGRLGAERMVFIQQLVARFGHHLAICWAIGGEIDQNSDDVKAIASYIREIDPYQNPIVLPQATRGGDVIVDAFVGDKNILSGISIAQPAKTLHRDTLKWFDASRENDHPWVIDGDVTFGPDPLVVDAVSRLWGNLMAGGGGVSWVPDKAFYSEATSVDQWEDLLQIIDTTRVAKEFFEAQKISYWNLTPSDALIENEARDQGRYAMAEPSELYLVYTQRPDPTRLNLNGVVGNFDVSWFEAIQGGALRAGTVKTVKAGTWVDLGVPPASGDDATNWVIIIRRRD